MPTTDIDRKQQDKLKKDAERLRLRHVAGGYYAPEADLVRGTRELKPGKVVTHKRTDAGKLVPIPNQEKQAWAQKHQAKQPKVAPGRGKLGKRAPAAASQVKAKDVSPSQTNKPTTPTQPKQFNYSKAIADVKLERMKSLKANLRSIQAKFDAASKKTKTKAPDVMKLAETFYKQFELLAKQLTTAENGTSTQKRTAAKALESFINDWQLNWGTGKKKLYANVFPNTGGAYKMLGEGGGGPTVLMKWLDDMAQQLGVPIPESTDAATSVASYFAGQSKPSMGDPRHAHNNPVVEAIFNSQKSLKDFKPIYKSLFGVTGPDGKLLPATAENSEQHFRYSVENNQSIDNTIVAAQEMLMKTKDPKYAGILKALKAHKARMAAVAENFSRMEPNVRAKVIGDSYAELAGKLYEADREIAGAVLKNVAEMALYDTEIAAGEEVYLPAHGSFPSGDKIKVTRRGTKVEKIKAVSVKYGKNGNVYGFPAECAKYILYHPDPRYRDLIENRAGKDTFETGVNNEIITEAAKWRQLVKESGFDSALSPKQINEIRNIGVRLINTITKKKSQLAQSLDVTGKLSPKLMKSLGDDPEIVKLNTLIAQILQSGDQTKLLALVGQSNFDLLMSGGGKNAMSFFSMMTFSAVLRTSNGLDTIEHNHQEMVDGQYTSVTENGTSNISDWQCMWRPWDDRGGGLIAGFNAHGNDKSALRAKKQQKRRALARMGNR